MAFEFENSAHAAGVLGYDYYPDSDLDYPEVDEETSARYLFDWHGINPSLYYTTEPTRDDTNGWFLVPYITPPDIQ